MLPVQQLQRPEVPQGTPPGRVQAGVRRGRRGHQPRTLHSLQEDQADHRLRRQRM